MSETCAFKKLYIPAHKYGCVSVYIFSASGYLNYSGLMFTAAELLPGEIPRKF